MAPTSAVKRAASEEHDEPTEQLREAKKIKKITTDEERRTTIGDPKATRRQKGPDALEEIQGTNPSQLESSDIPVQNDAETSSDHHGLKTNRFLKAEEVEQNSKENAQAPAGKAQMSQEGKQANEIRKPLNPKDSETEAKSPQVLEGEEDSFESTDKDYASGFEEDDEPDNEPYGFGPVPDRDQSGAWILSQAAEDEMEAVIAQQGDRMDGMDAYLDEAGIDGVYELMGIVSDSGDSEKTAEEKREKRSDVMNEYY